MTCRNVRRRERAIPLNAGRRESNAVEASRLRSAAAAETLSAGELAQTTQLCAEVDRMTRQREAAAMRARDDVTALVTGLRSRAAEAAHARDDAAESDTADLVGARRRRRARHLAHLAVVLVSLASFTWGSVHLYYWWVEGRSRAEVVYRYSPGDDGDAPSDGA